MKVSILPELIVIGTIMDVEVKVASVAMAAWVVMRVPERTLFQHDRCGRDFNLGDDSKGYDDSKLNDDRDDDRDDDSSCDDNPGMKNGTE